jgi:agmatine deiminase
VTYRLPAEWEPQDAVLIAWPHEDTDWGPVLARVEPAFAAMVREVSRRQHAVVLCRAPHDLYHRLAAWGANMDRVRLVAVPTNDTWARDFGPITLVSSSGARAKCLDFRFNGWGGKFDATLDDAANARLWTRWGLGSAELSRSKLILEGGSVESNGCGVVLTTAACLLAPGRNEGATEESLTRELASQLCASQIVWLRNGHLEGDDTDGHIDTLARFVAPDAIAYVRCDDPTDSHFESFAAMEQELRGLRSVSGAPYRLFPLPWPKARYGEAGKRLPMSYANFLIINSAVLVPIYGDARDAEAVAAVAALFPDREAVAIDCSEIIEQSGAVHCLTMQIPAGVLFPAQPSRHDGPAAQSPHT